VKTINNSDGSSTTYSTFVDLRLIELRRVRDYIDDAIERLEHVDEAVRGPVPGEPVDRERSSALLAYVPFNTEQACYSLSAAHEKLVEIMLALSADRARLTRAKTPAEERMVELLEVILAAQRAEHLHT